MASAAENRRGILFMLLAIVLFVNSDVLMKLAREAYPTGQAIALRTGFATAAALVFVLVRGDGGKIALALRPRVVLRGVIEALTAITYVWALGLMPIANVLTITMASPLLIVVLAVLLRIEQIGWRRTVALLVGFGGVLVVVRPGADGFGLPALIALASAVLVACRDLWTRTIGSEVPATVISLSSTVLVGLFAVGYGAVESWAPIWRLETVYLAIAAVLVATGTLFIVEAFRNTDVGAVAGYRYAVIVMAVLMGYLVWGDVPDLLSFCGMGLIVASGLYTLHRQRVRPDSRLKPAMEPIQ